MSGDMRAAIFFERDGILNLCDTVQGRPAPPLRLDELRIHPDAPRCLAVLKRAGFVLIGTTNQPAVSEGLLSRRELDLMHALLQRKLPLDALLMCPYDDPDHPCHKPQPGMFLEAAFQWSLDLDRSFVVSDKWMDAKAAQVAGCTSVMLNSPWIGDDHHDFVVADLPAAVAKILDLHEHLHGHTLAASA